MNPIINPIYIYIIGMVTPLNRILCGVWLISLILSIIMFAIIITSDESIFKEYCNRCFKRAFITFVISLIVYILIPNKETIIGMLIAQSVTTDRVEIATQVIKSTFDTIINAISK